MIYATKKKGESNERLMNRFKQVVQRSRIILKAKRERFHKKKLQKRVIRTSAVKRAEHRARKAKQQYYS